MRGAVTLYQHADGRRAKLVDNAGRPSYLVIRSDYGQGQVQLFRHYANHAGARSALTRRGGTWRTIRKTTY